jgi:tRNA threonylcarbamoyladenosine biosynthesis protein TsaB
MILVLRTDRPEVYVGIWDKVDEKSGSKWQAGRELSNDILSVIEQNCHKVAITLPEIEGILVYEGPGSYTGLRIAISTANAIGYSYQIPVVGATGDSWMNIGLQKLAKESEFRPLSPVYGGSVYTTKPKK